MKYQEFHSQRIVEEVLGRGMPPSRPVLRPATGATPSVRPRIEVSVEPAGSRATVPSRASCFFCLDPATVRVNDDPFCNRHGSKAVVELLALLLNLAKGV